MLEAKWLMKGAHWTEALFTRMGQAGQAGFHPQG